MSRRSLVALALVSPVATASAAPLGTPPTAYLGGGFSLGGEPELDAGLRVEGGHRVAGPLWLHAATVVGRTNSAFLSGDGALGNVLELHAGPELRGCVALRERGGRGYGCAFVGEDVGMRSVAWVSGSPPDGGRRDLVAVSQLGLDLFADRGFARVAFGLEHALAGTDAHRPDLGAARTLGGDGVVAFGYRW